MTVLILFVLYLTNSNFHNIFIEKIPLPGVVKEVDLHLTSLIEKKQDGTIVKALNSFEDVSENIIGLYDQTEYLRNCKIIDFKKELGTYKVGCGSGKTVSYHSVKLMSLYFPQKGECGYSDSKNYIYKTLNKRTLRLVIYGEENNIKYGYFYLGNVNINNDLLKRGLAFYIEHGMNDSKLMDSIWKSSRGLEGFFSKCSIENIESIQGKQILKPN